MVISRRRQRERETDRQTGRQTETDRDRQTDRQTETDRQRQTDRDRQREIGGGGRGVGNGMKGQDT